MSLKQLITLTLAIAAVVVLGYATVATVRAKAEASLSLTPNEFAAVRTAQVQVLQAQQALSQSQVWNDLQQAQFTLNKTVNTVITSRKLDPAKNVLCDGPVTESGVPADRVAACAGLAKGELRIRELKAVPVAAK